ncbi:uncharacterized protein LOC116412890 [Galleria mellonella]|uniref:Uncharacterized protein LOC116412890 n=1 Tax=Galleria mellonella TaxID=7137 RepID=A0A6J3C131_GALME|nr:uncharacterized protein LOC116412890 [Galleria mellonella]
MYNWRLLLLASLAVFQPIASFTERNLVDGRQECCDRQPRTLQRDTRLAVYGVDRFYKLGSEERRVNYRQEDSKLYRSNVDFDINSASIRQSILREKDPRRRAPLYLNDRSTRIEQRQTLVREEREPKAFSKRFTRNSGENDRINRERTEFRVSRIISETDRTTNDNTQSRTDSSRRILLRSITRTAENRNIPEQTRAHVVPTRFFNARNEPQMSREGTERRSSLSRLESRLQISNNDRIIRRSLERRTRNINDSNFRFASQTNDMMRRDAIRNSNTQSFDINLSIYRNDQRNVRNLAEFERRAISSKFESRLNNYYSNRRSTDQNERGVEDHSRNIVTSRTNRIYSNRKESQERREDTKRERSVVSEERRHYNRDVRQFRVNSIETEYRLTSRNNIRESNEYSRNERRITNKNMPNSLRDAMKFDRQAKSNFDLNNQRPSLLNQRTKEINNRFSADIRYENRNSKQRDERISGSIDIFRRETRSLDRRFREINERREGTPILRNIEQISNIRKEFRDSRKTENPILFQNSRNTVGETPRSESRSRVNENYYRRSSERRERAVIRENEHRSTKTNNKIQMSIDRYVSRPRSEVRSQMERVPQEYNELSNRIYENRRSLNAEDRVRSITGPSENSRYEARHERRNVNRLSYMNQYRERQQRVNEKRGSRDEIRANYDTRLIRDDSTRVQKTSPISEKLMERETVHNRGYGGNENIAETNQNIRVALRRNVEYRYRTKDIINGDGKLVSRLVESARNREDFISLIRNKTEFKDQAFVLSWQYLLYTLQGIYICTIIMQMLSEKKSGAKKVSWWKADSFKAPIKVD